MDDSSTNAAPLIRPGMPLSSGTLPTTFDLRRELVHALLARPESPTAEVLIGMARRLATFIQTGA